MNNIQFNQVTWYSKLAAAILFIILIPALSFYLGKEYGEVKALVDLPTYTSEEPQKITIVNTPSTNENIKYFKAISPGENGNIVGYFGKGEFLLYVPEWIPDHWKTVNTEDGGMTFYPKDIPIQGRDFSDIAIFLTPSNETNNAEALYTKTVNAQNEKVLCIENSRCEARSDTSIITSEILLSRVGESRIYHTAQNDGNGEIQDRFYIDGKKMTAIIHFTASKESYKDYANIIRDFVQGIGAADDAQG